MQDISNAKLLEFKKLIDRGASPSSSISFNVRSMVLILMSGQRVEMSVLVIYAQKRIYLPHFDAK